MEIKKVFIILSSIIGIAVFLIVAYYLTSQPQATYFESLATVSEGENTKWAEDGNIVFMEFSDFQCPACAQYAGMIKAIEQDKEDGKRIQDNVTFVYKHFPLDQIHPNAREGAYAAEAAARQDAFFPMHDLLFANQQEWSRQGDPLVSFKKYAEQLELDIEKFEADYEDKELRDSIQEDYVQGMNVEVQGTPTFYLNGRRLSNPQSAEELKNMLLQELAS